MNRYIDACCTAFSFLFDSGCMARRSSSFLPVFILCHGDRALAGSAFARGALLWSIMVSIVGPALFGKRVPFSPRLGSISSIIRLPLDVACKLEMRGVRDRECFDGMCIPIDAISLLTVF